MTEDIIEQSFGKNFKLLKVLGICPPDSKFCSGKMFKIFAYIQEILITVGFPLLGILQLITDNDMDMFQVADSLFVLSQLSLFPLKHVPFLFKYEKLDELVKKLKLKSFSDIHLDQNIFIENSIATCQFIFKMLYGLCMGCCIFYTLRPIYLNILLPTQIWLPFKVTDQDEISRYMAWFYCAYSGCHGVLATSAIDTIISGLVIHATGQIKILKNNLQFVGKRADEAVFHMKETHKSLARKRFIRTSLLEFADHYNDIIEFVKQINDLLSVAVFTQIFGSAVVICMMCYILSIVGVYSITGISFTLYIVSMLFQIFFYCFFGNDLIAESNSITDSIYVSNWYTYETSSKKILILIMERAKKPLMLTAGKVVAVSLPLFVAVLKQAYSLMAVLQSRTHTD
ncbi:hypothetical protein HHI36_007599 [Cryptolaemus montrouzieri]|uniref:Odorant receptor n=1 Tax=Cryptolaemus montrouzieri TaxID=559131 RepID=A0ABD2MQ09_9CUCU